ncbi:DUF4440 domain-containing protein [Ancylobacter pratisalsi]|uniref:DUF4440 domain-containing protein n=1 Tax=Ancylobacter pratisalsi TaxID=1745854 RepID=A0A6P1YKK1_9HYPH|nr:DUF4440 domain-containing protein [Ancylobacter pratisalsi]QIB33236.1 DUF4440 domain-containing protein [Ancylobacter pratisalsi]
MTRTAKALADELRALEQQLLDPARRADAAFLERILADDFQEIGQSGRRYDKPTVVRELALAPGFEGTRTILDFEARDVQEGVVLAIYTIAETGTLRSSLWRKRGGMWELVFHQGSRPSSSG